MQRRGSNAKKFNCEICSFSSDDEDSYDQHFKSSEHWQAMGKMNN